MVDYSLCLGTQAKYTTGQLYKTHNTGQTQSAAVIIQSKYISKTKIQSQLFKLPI